MTGGTTYIAIRDANGNKMQITSTATQIKNGLYEKIIHALEIGKKVVLTDCIIGTDKCTLVHVNTFPSKATTIEFLDAIVDVYNGDGQIQTIGLQFLYTYATQTATVKYFIVS